jgi:formate/nitrite transporter
MVFNPPVQIVSKCAAAGTYKCGLTTQEMLIRGFMSGAYIAMGAALATTVMTGTEAFLGAGLAKFVLGATFPVGLIITVLTGAELFTGDAMFGPLAAWVHKTSWNAILKLWVIVYIANLIGSIVFAYFMATGPFITTAVGGAVTVNAFGIQAITIASGKVSYYGLMGMWSLFLKGICCNWLVNLAIFLGICADDAVGKIFGIWFPIMAFVTSGFEHCVANMYFIPAGIMTLAQQPDVMVAAGKTVSANLNWIGMWTNNIILATIGNIVGAMLFVAFLYWLGFKRELESL